MNIHTYTLVIVLYLIHGIGISSSKSCVTIDGTSNGTMYEYTDQKKLDSNDGIYVTSSATSKVIVKNMNITGYNYYGIIYVPDGSSYKNVEVEYSGINYTGPQLSYNPAGVTRILDSVITIKENYVAANEVAECNRVELGGFTTIVHESTANSAFWFKNATPSFTVLRNGKVYFTSAARELFYGVNNLSFTVSKASELYISSANGLAYATYGTGTSLIDENSILSITKTKYNGSYATWYSYGVITVNKRSKT